MWTEEQRAIFGVTRIDIRAIYQTLVMQGRYCHTLPSTVIGAKVVSRGRYVAFQMAEVAIPLTRERCILITINSIISGTLRNVMDRRGFFTV